MTAKLEPLPYQFECLDEIDDHNGRALLALEQGLGKTLVSLWWCKRNNIRPIVVVCPASLKLYWRYIARQIGISGYVLNGREPSMPSMVTRPALVILNYDILPQWFKTLRRIKPQVVILDEVQAIKTRPARTKRSKKGIRTKAVRELCRKVPHVLALSGTPLLNRPEELWPTLNILRNKVFKSFRPFGMKFCKPRYTPWDGIVYDGSSKPKELNRLLRCTCLVRRLKSEVLKDLPPKMRSVVPMPLSDRTEYEEACTNFLRWLSRLSPTKAKSARKAVALSRMGHLKRLCARLKLRAVIHWINQRLDETDGKILVATIHRKMTDALVRRCGNRTGTVVIDGRVTDMKHRQYAVDRFQRDKNTRLFIGNIQAAGLGLNLQAANTVAFAELPWRPADCTQFEDRAHRIGQTDTVWVYYLVAGDTIEERLCDILQTKQSVISNVLDGGDREDDLNVFSQLLEYLETEK